jgi:uncharacterized glyoxalase superfamily protein PhnB
MVTSRRKKRPAKRAKPRPKRRKPETLRTRAITPSFTVNDLHRSIAWYEGVLGFVIADRWEMGGTLMGVELKAGATRLMIGQDDFAKGRDRQKGVGMRLYLDTTQDLDRLAGDITARGGVLAAPPKVQSWGDKTFDVTDPDGFHLTFVRRKR